MINAQGGRPSPLLGPDPHSSPAPIFALAFVTIHQSPPFPITITLLVLFVKREPGKECSSRKLIVCCPSRPFVRPISVIGHPTHSRPHTIHTRPSSLFAVSSPRPVTTPLTARARDLTILAPNNHRTPLTSQRQLEKKVAQRSTYRAGHHVSPIIELHLTTASGIAFSYQHR